MVLAMSRIPFLAPRATVSGVRVDTHFFCLNKGKSGAKKVFVNGMGF